MTRRGRRRGGRLGLWGLGGYGVALCALGAAGIAIPLLDGSAPTTGSRPASAQALPGARPAPRVDPPAPTRAVPAAPSTRHSSGPPDAVLAGRPVGPGEFRPLTVRLPSGRGVPVVPVGLDSAGALAIPADPQVVGWWTGGALAGEPFGSTVIAGHVDSRVRGVGAFAQLRDVRPGDVVQLAAGPAVIRYWVTSVTTVPKARLSASADPFRQDVANRLVMITCGGPFDRARHSYRDNVVIVAVPVA